MAEEKDLTRRERQIMDILWALGEASVDAVQQRLPDPPSYSATRTMLGRLEKKGHVRHSDKGMKYVYAPASQRRAAMRSATRRLVDVFYGGSIADAVTGIVDGAASDLGEAEIEQIEALISQIKSGRDTGGAK